MTTSRGGRGHRLPPFIVDDPGTWSIVAQVQRALGGHMSGLSRRQPATPGLLVTPQRPIPIPLVGIAGASLPVGAGRIRIAGALGDSVDTLSFSEDGATLFGATARSRRSWTFPTLAPGPTVVEERAHLAPPPSAASLADDLGDAVVRSAVAAVGAVIVRDGRLPALAIVGIDDGGIATGLRRWITGVTAAAWSPDGRILAIGGDWGILLALEPH
ncbi:MAG: hypothetical protein HYX33_01115 [Actinobacteria bacterium]|nr:hypothetical protein [Actinomycetota bacterium]